jgi:hypothetical protein
VLGNHNDSTGPNNAEYSIAIGTYAGQISQGTGSIAIGNQAGYQGQQMASIAIGVNAGSTNQGNNSIALGMNAGVTDQASNSIIINASGIDLNNLNTNSCVIKPIRNEINPNYLFYNATTGEITYDTPISSEKYKSDIKDLGQQYVDAIYNLRPVEFNFTDGCYNGKHSIGLIAEEVEKHVPEIVLYNELDKSVNGLEYDKLIAPLIKIVQEYKMRIEELEEVKTKMEELLQDCQNRIKKLEQNH